MIIESFKIKARGSGENAFLRTYILDSSKYLKYGKRPMVLICPGGGYEFVSQKEGEPLAMQFVAMGYHAAVLTYSVKPAVYPTQLLETAAAWKIIRENADSRNILADKIVIMGCSAGGHLAASYGIFCGEELVRSETGLSAKELRPAGMILCYPVISSGIYAHRSSFEALLGDRYGKDEALLEKMSLEKQVTADTPQTFIWHTFNDNVVPSENSLMLAMALKEKGVSCELHIFPDGGHGLALANEFTQDKGGYGIERGCQPWIHLAKAWLADKIGFGESLGIPE